MTDARRAIAVNLLLGIPGDTRMSSLRNATPTEYDRIASRRGAAYAARLFPVSMSYRFRHGADEHVWTMFFVSDAERARFARIILDMGGQIVGASGGDVSTVQGGA